MDINQRTVDRAEEMVEIKGLSFKAAYLVGSNYMSKVVEMKDQGIFAILAYKSDPNVMEMTDQKEWYTFTLKARGRFLRNEKKHDGYEAARSFFDAMVDTGAF